jgi:hypothetical protein
MQSTSRISSPYFILNSLPTLTTVAVRDSQLKAPTHILSSTDQNRSRKKKFLVSTTPVDRQFTLQSEAAPDSHTSSSSKRKSASTPMYASPMPTMTILPGLEQLDLEMCLRIGSLDPELASRRHRHAQLHKIKFTARGGGSISIPAYRS